MKNQDETNSDINNSQISNVIELILKHNIKKLA